MINMDELRQGVFNKCLNDFKTKTPFETESDQKAQIVKLFSDSQRVKRLIEDLIILHAAAELWKQPHFQETCVNMITCVCDGVASLLQYQETNKTPLVTD